MRKVFAVAMMTAMVGAIGFTQSADAAVTYDFVFRNTDAAGNGIAGGSAINGGKTFTFTSVTAAQGASGVVMDVFLRSTFELEAASTSIMWDDSNGLSYGSGSRWVGAGVTFNMMLNIDPNGQKAAPLGPLNCGTNICSSFNGIVTAPNGPPSLRAGTYNIGTIVWDTSALIDASAVMTTITALDGTGAIIPGGSGNRLNLTDTETLQLGFIGFGIVPEPATAGLLGLGLACLVLAGRRRARAGATAGTPSPR